MINKVNRIFDLLTWRPDFQALLAGFCNIIDHHVIEALSIVLMELGSFRPVDHRKHNIRSGVIRSITGWVEADRLTQVKGKIYIISQIPV